MTLPTIENDTLDGQKVLHKSLSPAGYIVITESLINASHVRLYYTTHQFDVHYYETMPASIVDIYREQTSHLPTTKCGWRVGEGVTVYDCVGGECEVYYDTRDNNWKAYAGDVFCAWLDTCTVTPKGAI